MRHKVKIPYRYGNHPEPAPEPQVIIKEVVFQFLIGTVISALEISVEAETETTFQFLIGTVILRKPSQ